MVFNDPLRELVHHFKYCDRVSLARMFGRMMRECLEGEAFEGRLVVPVPLYRSRLVERGFNQAELLARELGLPLDTHVVRRVRNTRSQTGLSRRQRHDNLRGAFEARQHVDRAVILVDDVLTTGSTVNEIARLLKKAGTPRVEVLTLARVSQTLSLPGEGGPKGRVRRVRG